MVWGGGGGGVKTKKLPERVMEIFLKLFNGDC